MKRMQQRQLQKEMTMLLVQNVNIYMPPTSRAPYVYIPRTQMWALALNGVGAFFWRVEQPKK